MVSTQQPAAAATPWWSPEPRGVRSAGFWLVVLAATLSYTVNSASSPLLTRGVQQELGGDAALSGALIATAAVTSLLCMAGAGALTDRRGPRVVALLSAAVAVAGVAALVVDFSPASIVASRLAYGAGNAGVTVATTAWAAFTTPERERGRALGYYGISVWVGLALGPLVAENVALLHGIRTAWLVLLVLQAGALLAALVVRGGRAAGTADRRPAPPAPPVRPAALLRAVWAPGLLALVAWGAEGLVTAFGIQHFEEHGVAAGGWGGASSLFVVLAATVVLARLALGGVTDRWGPARTAAGCLVVLAAGMLVLATGSSLPAAFAGAALVGVGYSPLYPALTLMATRPLPAGAHGRAVGLFSAATSAGYYLGTLGGGLAVDLAGTGAALAGFGLLQLLVLPVVRASGTGRRSAFTPS